MAAETRVFHPEHPKPPVRRGPTAWTLALCAGTLVLAGCSSGPNSPASMLQTRGDDTLTPITAPSRARAVEFVAVTPATIEGFAVPLASGDAYAVGAGDRVQLHVIDAPELSHPANGYLVEADGAVQLPFLGRVPMNAMSTAAIRADLVRRLHPYLPEPQVEVRVTEFNARHVAIVGAVRQPRRQVLTDRPLTVIDAINEAGGFVEDAHRAGIVLIRGGVETRVDITAFLTAGQETPVLRDGDVVRVGGAMPAPSSAAPASRLAVQTADGRLQTMALDDAPLSLAQVVHSLPMQGTRAYVLRSGSASTRALHLSMTDAMDPALGGRLMLRPGDAVALVSAASDDPGAALAILTPALRALTQF